MLDETWNNSSYWAIRHLYLLTHFSFHFGFQASCHLNDWNHFRMLLTEGELVLSWQCKRGCAPCMCFQCHLEHLHSVPNLLRKYDELIFGTCHQDVDIVLIQDFRILDQCGDNALNANHRKSPECR